MPTALTSQEKKVLGFITLMVVLGLVILGIPKCAAVPNLDKNVGASTGPKTAVLTP